MAGRYDSNPFDEPDEVNPFAVISPLSPFFTLLNLQNKTSENYYSPYSKISTINWGKKLHHIS